MEMQGEGEGKGGLYVYSQSVVLELFCLLKREEAELR
jgi:hypothetical protein